MQNVQRVVIALLIVLSMVAQLPATAVAAEGPIEVLGCTNETAINFNVSATVDDGSCVYEPVEVMTAPAGMVDITDPQNNDELSGLYQFGATFIDASPLTINGATYRIFAGTCASEGGEIRSGTMFNTSGSLAVTVNLASLNVGNYCFRVTVNSADESETSVSDSVNFTIINPSEVSISAPNGTVSGQVNFQAEVTFGTPALTEELDWSVYVGDCESEGMQVAGNTGGFGSAFTYSDGQFTTVLDTSSWVEGLYCFTVNPIEVGDVPNSVYAFRSFYVGYNTVQGQKYEDIDGDNRLNYEVDRLVGDYPIVATNEETGEVRKTTTDENGSYSFALPNGIWTISEGEKDGWSTIRAYNGWVLIDEGGESEIASLDCTISVGNKGELKKGFGEGSVCTFLNKQVPVSSRGGTRVRPPSGTPTVLGAATTTGAVVQCEGMYLTSYLKEGQENPTDQVVRLQLFLNTFGFTTNVTGTFDASTTEAVRNFQVRYATEVLLPWKLATGTGFVFKTTRATINNIVCPGSEVMPTI